jgi:hypothetical protein
MPEEKRPAESTPMSTSSPPGGPWRRPHVQRVQSVSDAYQGPPEVVSDSGLPFETSTELLAGLPPRVSNATLLSTTGEVVPPGTGTAHPGMSRDTPLALRAQAAPQMPEPSKSMTGSAPPHFVGCRTGAARHRSSPSIHSISAFRGRSHEGRRDDRACPDDSRSHTLPR